MNPDPPHHPDSKSPEEEMADADRANGERPVDDDDDDGAVNDTEARYGDDESPV